MMYKKLNIVSSIIIICISLVIILSSVVVIGVLEKNRFDFVVNDTLTDGKGVKGKVIILAGQSNAAGCSRTDYLKKNVSSGKYKEYEEGYDNVYINYYTRNNNQSKGFVKCKVGQGEPGGYFGPELGLAEALHEAYPDQLFFIIKCAWSGTNLYDEWLSTSSAGKTGKLYKRFIKYVESSLEYLVSKNYDIEIEGMCWMQGESDSFSVKNATDYEIHLKNFINDIRHKFKAYESEDGIAFIDAYIAAVPSYWVYYELINESKQKVADLSDINVVIDTNSYGLITKYEPVEKPDKAHYDALCEIKLGHLFAKNIMKFFG